MFNNICGYRIEYILARQRLLLGDAAAKKKQKKSSRALMMQMLLSICLFPSAVYCFLLTPKACAF
jgi:hypothetical protein